MLTFNNKIVQFGFGAVGKSFYEKLEKEIKFNENNYHVITMDATEFEAYVNLGGIIANFHQHEVTRENFKEIFGQYLSEGDLLIDFADTVGTRDICTWCADNNIMYINTGEADWPDNWYSIFNENLLKREIKKKFALEKEKNLHPIVLQHGNNPGLVSHFVKAALENIVLKQFKKDKELHLWLKENKFNLIARKIGLKMIHVNDIDLQEINDEYLKDKLYSTWCIDSFFFEMLSEATMNIGTHENIDYEDKCNLLDKENGFVEFKNIAADKKCRTCYPNGKFEGFLVPHEETITIANNLEVIENGEIVYRPTTMFIYSPCRYAEEYFKTAKVNNYPDVDPDKPQDVEEQNGQSIIRGYIYPNKWEIIYKEKIEKGTEYVGVLLIGDSFDPVWVGNRIESKFLYKDKNKSYWQTPTITPVAMSALAATCWMIKNKDKKGIFFPDEIEDYKYIIKLAEKYISKTIYKTLKKSEVEENIGINLKDIKAKDIFVEGNN